MGGCNLLPSGPHPRDHQGRPQDQERDERQGGEEEADQLEGEVEISGLKVTSIKTSAGGHVEVIQNDSNFKAEYKEKYTGEILPKKLIKDAIIEELSYFKGRVWEVAPRMKCTSTRTQNSSGAVLSNKGDHQADVRARLVACEANHSRRGISCQYSAT